MDPVLLVRQAAHFHSTELERAKAACGFESSSRSRLSGTRGDCAGSQEVAVFGLGLSRDKPKRRPSLPVLSRTEEPRALHHQCALGRVTRLASWARWGAGGQLRPLVGVVGAWALRMLPSAIMHSRWSCLSSQILNQNVMRLQRLARGVLDGGYCKLVGNLRLQNA